MARFVNRLAACLSIVLLLHCKQCFGGNVTPPQRLYWKLEDLGLFHLTIPGNIPDSTRDSPLSVLLHLFLTAKITNQYTYLRGYAFAEAVSEYTLNAFGHPRQPEAVMKWWYPITFRDASSYDPEGVPITLEPAIWSMGAFTLHYPALFEAQFQRKVQCVEVSVKDWLHTRQVCFPDTSPLDQWEKPEGRWIWSILPPWRGNHTDSFVHSLVHYNNYHRMIGFAGTVMYTSPQLLRQLLANDVIRQLAENGQIIIILWDAFNRYQPVMQNQRMKAVPDQILLHNSALLLFSMQPKALLLMGDIDEFFIPRRPGVPASALLDDPSCRLGNKSQPFGTLAVTRRNFVSSFQLPQPAYEEADEARLFVAAKPIPQCNPLIMYNYMSTEMFMEPKQFAHPNGGTVAFHVHNGVAGSGHALDAMSESCGFLMHVVNMWVPRYSVPMFTIKADWRWMMPNMTQAEYKAQCTSLA